MASARRISWLAYAAVALIASGCGASRNVTHAAGTGSRTMPDPAGCFVLVTAEPALAGDREYISGPVQHHRLTDLPYGRNWRHRIRSVLVGPRATVTLWTGERLKGRSMMLLPDATYPRLPDRFDRAVESLDIACAAASASREGEGGFQFDAARTLSRPRRGA